VAVRADLDNTDLRGKGKERDGGGGQTRQGRPPGRNGPRIRLVITTRRETGGRRGEEKKKKKGTAEVGNAQADFLDRFDRLVPLDGGGEGENGNRRHIIECRFCRYAARLQNGKKKGKEKRKTATNISQNPSCRPQAAR